MTFSTHRSRQGICLCTPMSTELRTTQRWHCCKELGNQRSIGPATGCLCDVTTTEVHALCITFVDVHPSSFDDGDSKFQTHSKYNLPHTSTLDESRLTIIHSNKELGGDELNVILCFAHIERQSPRRQRPLVSTRSSRRRRSWQDP